MSLRSAYMVMCGIAQSCYVVRISALAQRAEYIWADGLEGDDSKVTTGAKR